MTATHGLTRRGRSRPRNGEIRHCEDADVSREHSAALAEGTRVESTGKAARGRKHDPAKPSKKVAAKAQKEVKPKAITNDRDAWVDATARQIKDDPTRAIEAIVMTIRGYDGF